MRDGRQGRQSVISSMCKYDDEGWKEGERGKRKKCLSNKREYKGLCERGKRKRGTDLQTGLVKSCTALNKGGKGKGRRRGGFRDGIIRRERGVEERNKWGGFRLFFLIPPMGPGNNNEEMQNQRSHPQQSNLAHTRVVSRSALHLYSACKYPVQNSPSGTEIELSCMSLQSEVLHRRTLIVSAEQ